MFYCEACGEVNFKSSATFKRNVWAGIGAHLYAKSFLIFRDFTE